MILREWAPLADLFNRLPSKAQSGIFTYDIKLTCVDVLTDFIALGTNFGLVYWYNRRTKDLQKLRCENTSIPVTTLKVISTVDYMVACGNQDGSISIFQVPKSHHESLPENLRPKNKQIERYTVSDLHSAPITALQWTKNGMKLFSGDKLGHIVLTEIDFYMHLCKSIEILNESYEVVQLSYHHQNLLVSTMYRSIVCKKENKWKVSQVGKKDRKALGNFGGIFHQNSLRSNDVVLYCTRPGLRIWVSDIEGCVQQTLLFKDILNQRSSEAQLINPVSKSLRKLLPQKEASFGVVLPFQDHLLVTYNNDVVYVLNPKELTVDAMISNLRGVLGVAVCKDEIFILEGERSLIRISENPEPIYDMTPPIPTASNFRPISTSIKDLTHKIQTSSIISAIPPFIEMTFGGDLNIHTDSTSVINAEEATESPRRRPKPNESYKKLQIYDKISNQNFDDDILYKTRRPKKAQSVASWSSNSSDEHDGGHVSKPTIMTESTVNILPDLRSPESIKNDIESKEKLLADVLCFGTVEMSAEPENVQLEFSTKSCSSNESSNASFKSESYDNRIVTPVATNSEVGYGPPLPSSNYTSVEAGVPACVKIPNDWQLQNVSTKQERKITESSISDSDWEII
uniref:HPS5-like beta-propeller domain-containing protein n=2 Tax=Photinus pyralis TaxID=7054 RepID=A0A1Y1MJB7_PHOPY